MDIELKNNSKPINATLALPEKGSGPGVLVLHAWWGLNPFFKDLCGRLAEQGFVVLAPDLNNGQIAQTVAEAEALMQTRDNQSTGDAVMYAKDYLLAHPAVTSQKIGVIGFSMGAAWALVLASEAPEQVAATVLFYGANAVEFNKVQSRVMGHFSDVDEWEPLEGVREVEKDMRSAGVDVTLYMYPGLPHWFVEDDRPEYNPQAASLAWERTIAFLRDNLS